MMQESVREYAAAPESGLGMSRASRGAQQPARYGRARENVCFPCVDFRCSKEPLRAAREAMPSASERSKRAAAAQKRCGVPKRSALICVTESPRYCEVATMKEAYCVVIVSEFGRQVVRASHGSFSQREIQATRSRHRCYSVILQREEDGLPKSCCVTRSRQRHLSDMLQERRYRGAQCREERSHASTISLPAFTSTAL